MVIFLFYRLSSCHCLFDCLCRVSLFMCPLLSSLVSVSLYIYQWSGLIGLRWVMLKVWLAGGEPDSARKLMSRATFICAWSETELEETWKLPARENDPAEIQTTTTWTVILYLLVLFAKSCITVTIAHIKDSNLIQPNIYLNILVLSNWLIASNINCD